MWFEEQFAVKINTALPPCCVRVTVKLSSSLCDVTTATAMIVDSFQITGDTNKKLLLLFFSDQYLSTASNRITHKSWVNVFSNIRPVCTLIFSSSCSWAAETVFTVKIWRINCIWEDSKILRASRMDSLSCIFQLFHHILQVGLCSHKNLLRSLLFFS